MTAGTLRFTVRTPHDVVLEIDARSLRVPTETGHVGLRPRAEPMVLAVEASLILVRTDTGQGVTFVGTAGGLLTCDGLTATLLTPLAVAGDDEESIMQELETALAEPSEEMQARAMLGRLESQILSELRHEGKTREPAGGDA